jgi:hypothetical protein
MPHPHSTPRARSWRSRLERYPALIAKITAEPIATAKASATIYDLGTELRPTSAAVIGTIYRRLLFALTKLAGHKCPEALEIKRLLKLYAPQIARLPLFISEKELRSKTQSPADGIEDDCVAFIKAAISAYKRGDMRADTKQSILEVNQKFRAKLNELYPIQPSEIAILHNKLNAIELMIAPHQGTA